MKKLFLISVKSIYGNPLLQTEIISDKNSDAVNIATEKFKNCGTLILECSHVPFTKMTVQQKMKVIDADWNAYENKLRNRFQTTEVR